MSGNDFFDKLNYQPMFHINKPRVRIPSLLENPLVRNMGRIVNTFEFPCNPPFRIWLQVLPEVLADLFITYESPDVKHIFKEVFGKSWLCEARQVVKRAVPVELAALDALGEILVGVIEHVEALAFWYWVVGIGIDAVIQWATLARKASVCGGFGWLDATPATWSIVDNGQWQPIKWPAWKIGGTQISFDGTKVQIPNSATYGAAFQLTGECHVPTRPASFAARLVTDTGTVIKQTPMLVTNPATKNLNGTFTNLSLPGVGTSHLWIEAMTGIGTGDVFFTDGNFVVSATDNMAAS